MPIEEFGSLPGLAVGYRRAVLRAVSATPTVDRAPAAELLVRGVPLSRHHVARYARVCGFRLTEEVPPTYPHVVAFPLTLQLLTRADFPFALAGLVHIANTIEQIRPVSMLEDIDVSVRAENLRDHDRGRAIDVLTVVAAGDRVVWRERSTYLRRSRSKSSGRPAPPWPAEAIVDGAAAVWPVSTAVGPAYAGVSGDRNPIHTSRIAAGLFGFRRPVAHGMWSIARCLAALEGRVPARCVVDVTLKGPILLPATVAFSAEVTWPGRTDFALRDALTGRPHLTGSIT